MGPTVQLIAKPMHGMTGTSRYVTELNRELRTANCEVEIAFANSGSMVKPLIWGLKKFNLDLETFLSSYPLDVVKQKADVYHITSQTMATLLLTHRFPGPVVITVLDIIPYLVQNDPSLNTFGHPMDRLFYQAALRMLQRADALIAISDYTKQTLVDVLRLQPERIHVTHLAIDHERFHPMEVSDEFRTQYGLDQGNRYVLYFGSDDPRKNVSTLIRAFHDVKDQLQNLKLVIAGRSQFPQEHLRLMHLIHELEMDSDVLFLNDVLDADLPVLYNTANVLVMPSLFEGFGLPALEAMACGTPVIVSNRTSLPELVGSSALTVDPTDIHALSEAIHSQINADEKGHPRWIDQAARFTWAQTAHRTLQVYKLVMS